MVGKGLTLERAKELQADKYGYSVHELKGGLLVRFEEEDVVELTTGAVDIHMHAYPDNWQRPSIVNIGERACELGVKAMVWKCHKTSTAGESWILQHYLDMWASQRGLEATKIYGGITFNKSVGGVNPDTLREQIVFPHFKTVWMPTHDSDHEMREVWGQEGGITILDEKKELKPEAIKIVDIIAKNEAKTGNKVLISACHLWPNEIIALIKEASSKKVDVLVDHVTQELTKLTIDQMKEMVDLGAYLGLYALSCVPNFYIPMTDPFNVKRIVEEIDSKHIVIASDCGQPLSVLPPDGLKAFIRTLLALGISKQDIKIMVKDNPAKLLGLPSDL